MKETYVVTDLADSTQVERRLTSWVQSEVDSTATVSDTRLLDGHSGFSHCFTVTCKGEVSRYVIRVSVPGSAAGSTADALRAVPILTAMREAGVPVPRPRWWSGDPEWFGANFTVVDFVAGRTLPDVFSTTADVPDGIDVDAVFRSALMSLAAIHAVPVTEQIVQVARRRDLEHVIDASLRPMSKASSPEWITAARRVRDLLLETKPVPVGDVVVHNDFYSNNWIVDDQSVRAVLDWETCIVGEAQIDLGWLVMMYDPASWGPTRQQAMTWAPAVDRILELVDSTPGVSTTSLGWYRALAGYRLACGTAHYLSLHRDGSRPDPAWENFDDSVAVMLARAEELLREPLMTSPGE